MVAKKIFWLLGQKMFLLFILLAAVMKFIYKLNGTYTTEITIPVEFVVDYESNIWIENDSYEVNVTAQGRGSTLLFYKLGFEQKVSIPLSSITTKVTERNYSLSENYLTKESKPTISNFQRTIDQASLLSALSRSIKDLMILQVISNNIELNISPMAQVKLPIISNIEASCQRQYMQVGNIKLSSDSITVKAPMIILDTLKSIATEQLKLHSLKKPEHGSVELIIPQGVISPRHSIEYWIDVKGYTEFDFTLPVIVKNVPDSMQCITIPSEVTVTTIVPLESLELIESMAAPVASVNYEDLNKNLSLTLRVSVDSLEYGMEVRSITPSYVEPFFID